MTRAARSADPQTELPGAPIEATAGTLARPVLVVGDDMTAAELAHFLLDRGLTAAAVTNEGKVIAFVSMTDLVREHVVVGGAYEESEGLDEAGGARNPRLRGVNELHAASASATRVRDLVLPSLLALEERSTAAQAAAVMAAHRVHRLLVVAENGEAVGVIHAVDLLRHFARLSGVYIPDEPSQG